MIALIAGEGSLPEVIAERLARDGDKPTVYALRSNVDAIAPHAAGIVPLIKADVKAAVADMMMKGVRRVIFAGAVPKALIYDASKLDDAARGLLASLASRDDHSLLGAVVSLFERAGFEVAGYADIIGDLIAPEGDIAGREPSDEERSDIDYGVKIASAVVPLSFGQSVVVRGRSVVAVEAMEGTDAVIARAGAIAHGGVLVKMMRADQDRRFDIPTVGPTTLRNMASAGLTCLAVHAGSTILMSRDEFSSLAGELGISVVGFKGTPQA